MTITYTQHLMQLRIDDAPTWHSHWHGARVAAPRSPSVPPGAGRRRRERWRVGGALEMAQHHADDVALGDGGVDARLLQLFAAYRSSEDTRRANALESIANDSRYEMSDD
jgi:hypothetical protein